MTGFGTSDQGRAWSHVPDLVRRSEALWRGRLLDGHFEPVEPAVLAPQRGRGTGAALLEALLGGRSEPRVLLQTFDGATPAMRLYRRHGFTPVAVLDGMPVLVKDLP